MVSSQHEAMHRIFRHDPGPFARIFHTLDLPFSDPLEVEHLSVDLTEIEPIERRADTILRIVTAESTFLLVVEAQSKKEASRPRAWAYYLAYLHAKYKLPVVLVVVCRTRATAEWAEGPHNIGHATWPCVILRPLVLGPHNVPVITTVEAALADLPLTALSAITHATSPEIGAILEALSGALHLAGDRDDAQIYSELVELGLGRTRGAHIWRKLMSVDLSFFRSETSQRMRREAHEEGRMEGRTQDILRILQRRGIELPAAARAKISSCHDVDELDVWFDRAFDAQTADDLFSA
ncbi:hypothetical protein ACFWUP_09120 [Nocardia sp. NPDC058658]|uniref:hypothetical protein n=1 Tax=Nocardia sp. NPDC058658 TaxID=3346580 RepID=UPI0036493109